MWERIGVDNDNCNCYVSSSMNYTNNRNINFRSFN